MPDGSTLPEKVFYMFRLVMPGVISGLQISLRKDTAQILDPQHIDGKAEEHVFAAVIIFIEKPSEDYFLLSLFGKIGLDTDLLCFRHILFLIPVRDQRIVPVDAVISLAGIFAALKAIIHIAVLHAAGRYGAGLITGAAVEAAAAFPPDLHGTKPAVESAEGEESVGSVEFVFHQSVLLFLRIAASLSISP